MMVGVRDFSHTHLDFYMTNLENNSVQIEKKKNCKCTDEDECNCKLDKLSNTSICVWDSLKDEIIKELETKPWLIDNIVDIIVYNSQPELLKRIKPYFSVSKLVDCFAESFSQSTRDQSKLLMELEDAIIKEATEK